MTSLSSNTQTIGLDYGLKLRVALASNADFPSFLHNGFVALAYGRIPNFDGLRDVPCLGMCFDDAVIARQCFSIFNEWTNESDDGDALSLSFIEFDDGQYGICLYPDTDRLVQRMVLEKYRNEIDPIILFVGYLKKFPRRSRAYMYFKNTAEGGPFVLFPQLRSGPLMEFAILKKEVRFLKEIEVSIDSMEGGLLGTWRDDPERRPLTSPTKAAMTRSQVAVRRRRQMSRFYPVTLERLGWDATFETTCRTLECSGYRRWQIEQAACTLLLRQGIPNLFHAQNAGELEGLPQLSILDHLLSSPEVVTDPLIPVTILKEHKLREQIVADSAELLAYFAVGSDLLRWNADLQSELSEYDLLDG